MPTSSTRRPNIVMILTDDHASHAISSYGSVINRTPRIDEIAASGARFENCFATNALCTPSRASILTGTYSHVNGVKTLLTHIDASQPTFISQLRESGYRTAIIGKWHMGDGDGHNPENFDYWDVLIDQGEYHNPQFLSKDGVRVIEGYVTDIITDLATTWVESLDGDAPWCVLVHHKAPHRPWEPDEAHAGMYSEPIPVPRTFWDDLKGRSSATRRATMRIAEFFTTDDLKVPVPEGLRYEEECLWKYQRYLEDYLACVASIDDNVGRLTDWLRKREQFDDTLMMYASDQGFFLGEHGWFDKRFMYEESLRMPLVLSYPRAVPVGSVHSGIVTNVDFAQTILDAAGVEHHQRMQGRSFWGDLTGVGALPPATGMYYRYWENDDINHRAPAHYGYRDDRYKLIYFYNDGLDIPGTGRFAYPPEWEMYDLETDPDEVRNVAHHPAYSAIRERLEVAMWVAQRELGDEPHHSQPVPAGLA